MNSAIKAAVVVPGKRIIEVILMKKIIGVFLFALSVVSHADELKLSYSLENEVTHPFDHMNFSFSPDSRYLYFGAFDSGTVILNSENGSRTNADLALAVYWLQFRDQPGQVLFHGKTRIKGNESSGFAHFTLDVPSGELKKVQPLAKDLGTINKNLIVSSDVALTQSYHDWKDSNFTYNIFDVDSGNTLCRFELNRNFQVGRWNHASTDIRGEVFLRGKKAVLWLRSEKSEAYVAVYNCERNTFEVEPVKAVSGSAYYLSSSGQFLISWGKEISGTWDENGKVYIYDLNKNSQLVLEVAGFPYMSKSNDTLLVLNKGAEITQYNLSGNEVRAEGVLSLPEIEVKGEKKKVNVKQIKFDNDRFWFKYTYRGTESFGLGYLKTSEKDLKVTHLSQVDKKFPLYNTFSNSEIAVVAISDDNNRVTFKEIDLTTKTEKHFTMSSNYRSYEMSPDGKKLAISNLARVSEKIIETLKVFDLGSSKKD